MDPKDGKTPDKWVPRHPDLVRLTGIHPFNCEPALKDLMKHGHKTPASLHYVRNHGAVPVTYTPETKKQVYDDWRVTLKGPDEESVLTMADLEKLPYREVECLLVCAGNRRKEQNMVKRTIGFNWGPAGLGISTWGGCYLADVLDLLAKKDGFENYHVRFRGPLQELPAGSDGSYGTSLTWRYAMEKANDVILAWHHNGELLQPDHGYPLRIIIPGFIGGRMVKWLSEIEIATTQSQNHYHFKDNRVLPVNITPEQADKEGWWFKPDYIINELNINSAIARPAHDEHVIANGEEFYTLEGYAYSGGGRKVIRVEITLDNGESWTLVNDDDMVHPEHSPTEYGKYWGWVLWKLKVPVLDVVNAQTIKVRAWDSAMNTQPHLLTWNVMGMLNNPAFTVLMHQEDGGRRAEHPTMPGQQPGGWMTAEAKLGKKHVQAPLQVDETPKDEVLPTTTTTMKTTTVPEPEVEDAAAPELDLSETIKANKITRTELAKHSTETSCWIEVNGVVFDATEYLEEHPGGAESIKMLAGQDATEDFAAIHSVKAWKILEKYAIGVISSEDDDETTVVTPTTVSNGGVKKALQPGEKIKLELIEKEELTHNSYRLRFALPSKSHVLGLPVGKHVLMYGRSAQKGSLVARAYTPTTADNVVGYVDFVIKAYRPCAKFPAGGALSPYLCDTVKVGASVEFRGPLGHIEYLGPSSWRVSGKTFDGITHFGMIAGGTGVTPMVQILINALPDGGHFSLILANQSVDDILCKTDLDALAAKHANLHLWYTVDKCDDPAWKYDTGFVTKAMIDKHLPAPGPTTLIACCGPPPMMQFACKKNLDLIGHPQDRQLYF